jgi:hypothetical protein
MERRKMGIDSSDIENLAQAIQGSIRDSFMDYGGAPNVIDSLNNIANAVEKLAEAGFEIARAINSLKNI